VKKLPLFANYLYGIASQVQSSKKKVLGYDLHYPRVHKEI